MIIKINSYEGKSWESYIDNGLTFIEVDGLSHNTQIGLCSDGLKLCELFKSLGLEVEYNHHYPIDNLL